MYTEEKIKVMMDEKVLSLWPCWIVGGDGGDDSDDLFVRPHDEPARHIAK